MSYTCRRLGSSNVEELKGLLVVFARVFDEAETATPAADDTYLTALLEKPEFHACAAWEGDEVVGGVTGYELALPSGRKEMYIYDLAIEERHWRRGIATALIRELAAGARRRGVSVMFVEAESADAGAVRFYQSLGAEQLGVEHFNLEII
jgi:aminoglycoside 3-N-acetyltransferase I